MRISSGYTHSDADYQLIVNSDNGDTGSKPPEPPIVLPTIIVGSQVGTLRVGSTEIITFPITTWNLPDGDYRTIPQGAPDSVSILPYSYITVANGTGTLSFRGSSDTVEGTAQVTLHVDVGNDSDGNELWVTSNSFTLTIQPRRIEPPSDPSSLVLTAEVTQVGVKLRWNESSNRLGYRIFRSTSVDSEGVSITDFPIIGSEWVDVNVNGFMNYYYRIRSMISEADPFNDKIPACTRGLLCPLQTKSSCF